MNAAGMQLGHWLIVAAFAIAIGVPTIVSAFRKPKPQPPCICPYCQGRRAHYAAAATHVPVSQQVVE